MNNYNEMQALIATYSGKERNLNVPVIYIELTGDLNTAAILNQSIFWSDKSARKDGFFYKTYAEWNAETTLSEYQVRRSVKILKNMGVIDTKLKKANGSPTLHYKLDMVKLSESILKKLKNRNLINLSNDKKETEVSLTVDDSVDDYSKEKTLSDKSNDENCKMIVSYLNEKTGSHYKYKSKATKGFINGRMSEGHTVDDFKRVIDVKVAEWYKTDVKIEGTPAEMYLRPSTLFSSKNFENYVNQKPVRKKTSKEKSVDDIFKEFE